MKRFARIIFTLVILLTGTPLLNQVQGQGDDRPWPYMMYYSYKTGSWIIERADGTDGFAFGAGLNCGWIRAVDWSSSGRWLSWGCVNRSGYGDLHDRWIAVRADDSERVTALDSFTNLYDDFARARWSPGQDDLLMVNTVYRPGEAREWGPGVYIIDVNQDRVIQEVTFDVLVDRADWSPDGRFVLAYCGQCSDDEGTITIIPVNGEPPFTHKGVTTPRGNYSSSGMDFIWTPDNRLIGQLSDTGQLILEDLSTGSREVLPFTTTPVSAIWYSSDNEHGLIYAGSELWLHALSTGTLTQIASDVVPLPHDRSVFEEEQPSFHLPGWSPEGRRALFATQDGRLHWLHADGRVTALDLPPTEEFPVKVPRVQWGGDKAFILWNDVVYIYSLTTEGILSVYTRRDTSSYRHDPPLLDTQVSPDGRYMAYPGGLFGYYVWDWANDVETYLVPTPVIADSERMPHSEAYWHPRQSLLFVAEFADLAGPALIRWSVASPDGRLLRALSSVDGGGAPQALPPQVDTTFIPPSDHPLVPGPSLQITQSDFLYGILSWSPGGRYLAVAPSNRPWKYAGACFGGDNARIYDAVTGEKVAEFVLESCGCGYHPPASPKDRPRDAYLSFKGSHTVQLAQSEWFGSPLDFAWPPTDQQTVVAIMIDDCRAEDRLVFWDFMTDEVLAEYPGVRTVAFTRDGTRVALGYDNGRVVLAPYPEMKAQATFTTLPTPIDHLVFSADGSRLAVASAPLSGTDGELSVYETGGGERLFHMTLDFSLDTVDLTPDGSTLVLAAQQPYRCVDSPRVPPTLIDVISGEAITDPNTSLTAAAVSPDGRYLAGTGCGLVVWERDTLDVVASLLGNGINVRWSPDGSRLATATRYGVYVWDMP